MANQYQNGSTLLKAGDYVMDLLEIRSLVSQKSLDLRGLVKKVEVYEDLFSPYLTAKLYIEDSFNFPEKLPITGQEVVDIRFKADINDFKPVSVSFRVYKLDNHQIGDNSKSQTYTLHLMSVGGYLNYSQFCGYSLKGSTSKMVQTIFEKHFPDSVWKDRLFIEPSRENYSLVVPGSHTPFKAINWLTSRAFTERGQNYSPYYFYETLDGYCYKSLTGIMEDGFLRRQRYTYMPPNLALTEDQVDSVPFATALPPRYHKILGLEDLERFDMATNISHGVVSSRLVVHDLVRKQQRYSQFFEGDVFETKAKMGTQPLFKEEKGDANTVLKTGAAFYYLPSTPYTVYNRTNSVIDNFQYEETFLKHRHHTGTMLTHKLAMLVYGDSRRRVGDVATIDITRIQSDGFLDPSVSDKNLGGNYMITSVRHDFSTAYTCKYELSKTCMGV